MLINLYKIDVHGLAHFKADSQIDRYEGIINEEEAAKGLEGEDCWRISVLEDVSVRILMVRGKSVIEVG